MSEIDISRQLKELSEKMDRYEKHREEQRKDIKAVSDRQSELVTLLAGSDLNGKKGFFNLIDKIDDKIDLMNESISLMKKDIENVKFWGRGASGILFATVLIIVNYIKDKI